MREWLDERIGYFDQKDHLLDLNNIESPVQHIRVVFDLMDTRTSAVGARRRAARDDSRRSVGVQGRARRDAGGPRRVEAPVRSARPRRKCTPPLNRGGVVLPDPLRTGVQRIARARRALGRAVAQAANAFRASRATSKARTSPARTETRSVERPPPTGAAFLGTTIDPSRPTRGAFESSPIDSRMARFAAHRPGPPSPS